MTEQSLMDFVTDAKCRIIEVDIDTTEKLLEEGYKILDIREPGEYLSGALENSLHVPRGVLEIAADKEHPAANPQLRDHRNDKWLVLCNSDRRSVLATDILMKMGFTDIKSVIGGYGAWAKAKKATLIPSDENSPVRLK